MNFDIHITYQQLYIFYIKTNNLNKKTKKQISKIGNLA